MWMTNHDIVLTQVLWSPYVGVENVELHILGQLSSASAFYRNNSTHNQNIENVDDGGDGSVEFDSVVTCLNAAHDAYAYATRIIHLFLLVSVLSSFPFPGIVLLLNQPYASIDSSLAFRPEGCNGDQGNLHAYLEPMPTRVGPAFHQGTQWSGSQPIWAFGEVTGSGSLCSRPVHILQAMLEHGSLARNCIAKPCGKNMIAAIPLSEDHKPNRSDERQRIEQAGGNVMWAGTWRVGGVLAVSRAFGNRLLKRFVVAEPEIQEEIIKDDVEFLVIASDGLWDVISNEDAVSLVKSIEDPEAAARKLTETAFAKGSADNITCVVVRFNHSKGGGANCSHIHMFQRTPAQ
eukprot:Gb_23929 [translate_table: standard]